MGQPYGARSKIKKRSVIVSGRQSSVSLEDEFWDEVRKIAHLREQSVQDFVADVLKAYEGHNLSSALRVYVLQHYRSQR